MYLRDGCYHLAYYYYHYHVFQDKDVIVAVNCPVEHYFLGAVQELKDLDSYVVFLVAVGYMALAYADNVVPAAAAAAVFDAVREHAADASECHHHSQEGEGSHHALL
jgi:hypothetical protein